MKFGGMLGNVLSEANKIEKEKTGKVDMGQEEKNLIRDDNDEENHYVWMQARFNEDRLWVWIVNLIAYIAVITTYFCVDGHEIIYSIYLPLDIMLNVSKAIYFFAIYWLNNRERKKREELQQVLKAGVEDAVKTGVANLMRGSEQRAPEQNIASSKRVEQMKLQYEMEINSQKKKQRLLQEVEE